MRLIVLRVYKSTSFNTIKRHSILINTLKLNNYFKKQKRSKNYFQVIFSSKETLRLPSGCTSV